RSQRLNSLNLGVNFGRFQIVHDILTSLPYPLAPKGKKGYKTAIQCLCSLEPLSNTLSTRVPAMERIVTRRLEMLKLFEVKLLLQKKWKYVGKRRFMIRLTVYLVFLFFLNVTTLFERNAYRTGSIAHVILLGIAEVGCFGLATVKFMNETNQLILNFKSYTTEAGAGRLDNVCTFMTSTSLYLSAVMRATQHENLEDAFAAIALIFAWFYLFFFLLGFRSTGPFVIMILNMIMNDIVRFIFVHHGGVLAALYLVQDGRAGVKTLLHRIRMLVIAGFTGEVNYDDTTHPGE
uniref:Ion transport domain-containing protein n=1 Tax=Globisporangium ultimum (strain ATCC 200006 / CBS 805.95 / DAOM BR144) TaxID=431595 RepID=K3X354_GLOUD